MSLKKFCKLAIFLFLPITSFAESPVGTHGALFVSDGKILGSKDSLPTQVAGMCLFWSLWEGEKYYTKDVVNWLVKDWNITVIRASLGIGQAGSYDTDPNAAANQYDKIKTIVDAAIANGIYVIVDYHAHDANKSVDKAKKFFGDMSKEYAKSPNIIWEIWNEPDDKNGSGFTSENAGDKNPALKWDTWEDVKKYAAEVIPEIRKNSDNLIVVGTPSWSQDVEVAAADPIAGPNIAYTLHFYAAQKSHQDSLRTKAQKAVDLGAALFITEFGTTIADGGSDGVVDSLQTKIWLDWADSNGISWANWSIVDKGEASGALKSGASTSGGWTDANLSVSGKLIRGRLKSRRVYDYSEIIPVDGKSLPGLIEAESFKSKSDGLKSENTSDAGGGQSLGYTSNGAWAEYLVTVRNAGDYTARLRVATDQGSGGTITIKIGDKKVAAWTVSSTGGWSSWKTTDNCAAFKLSTGETKLRIEWSGTASSLVNLNWIVFTYNQDSDTSDTTPSDTTTPPDSTISDGKSLPGRIEAESLKSKSTSLTVENTSDTGGGQSLGYTTDGAWAEYPITVRKSGEYSARLRVASDQGFGGTVIVKIGDKKVASWTIGSTGGWSSWKTTDSCDTFTLSEGESELRVEWSGTASSLVNLNWMEFTYCPTSEKIHLVNSMNQKSVQHVSIKNGILTLIPSEKLSRVTLLMPNGRILYNKNVNSKQIQIPLKNGLHILKVQSENGSVVTIPVMGMGN
jgi:endoglucanase